MAAHVSDPALAFQAAMLDILLSIETALAPALGGIVACDVDMALFADALQAADGRAGCGDLDREALRGPNVDAGPGWQGLATSSRAPGTETAASDERVPAMLRPLQTASVLSFGGSALATLAGVRWWVADRNGMRTPILGHRDKPAVTPIPSVHLPDPISTRAGMPAPRTAAAFLKIPYAGGGTAALTTETTPSAMVMLPTLSPVTGASAPAGTGTGILLTSGGCADTERGSGRRIVPPPGLNSLAVAPTNGSASMIRSDGNIAKASQGLPDPAMTTLAPAPVMALRPIAGLGPQFIPAARPRSEPSAGELGRMLVPGAGTNPSEDLRPSVAKPKRFQIPIDKPSDSDPSVPVAETAPSTAPHLGMPDPVGFALACDRRSAAGAGQTRIPSRPTKAPFRSPVTAAEHVADGHLIDLPPGPALPTEAPLTPASRDQPPATSRTLDNPARQGDSTGPRKQDEVTIRQSGPLIGTSVGGIEPQLPVKARTPSMQLPNKESAFGKSDQDRDEPGTSRRGTTDATSMEWDPKTASKSDGVPHFLTATAAPDCGCRASDKAVTFGGRGGREHRKTGSETLLRSAQRERTGDQDAASEPPQIDAAASPSLLRTVPELFGQEAPPGLPVWTGLFDNGASKGTADKGGRIRSGLKASAGRLEEPQADEEDIAGRNDGLPQRLEHEAAFVYVPRERNHLLPEVLARDGSAVTPITDLQLVKLVGATHKIVIPGCERIIVRFAATTLLRPSGFVWGVGDVAVGQLPPPYEARGPPPLWSARKSGMGATSNTSAADAVADKMVV